MCTDIDDAESMYGKPPIASYYYNYIIKNRCEECGGKGHKGLKKDSLFFIQCKKCNGTGREK